LGAFRIARRDLFRLTGPRLTFISRLKLNTPARKLLRREFSCESRPVLSFLSMDNGRLLLLSKHDADDLVPRLERLLAEAKEGKIRSLAAVYYHSGEPSYTLSYRTRDRIPLVGLLAVLQNHLMELIECA
jgi:hypothetical protein